VLPAPEAPTSHPAAADVEFLSWPQFRRRVRFAQGEHITLIGRTRSGKTTLTVAGLLPRFPHVVAMSVKPRDRTPWEAYLQRRGYKLTDSPRLDAKDAPRVIFKPPQSSVSDTQRERELFRLALDVIYHEGGWAVYLDEVRYLAEDLRLGRELTKLWVQGAGMDITMIASTQEPVAIPRVAFSQIEHLFIWRLTDADRVKRAAELAGSHTEQVRAIVPTLARHEALYVAPQADLLLRTRYPHALS
jgi:hypothetical protein